jgi:nucleoside-diphosphate-sugar epimerase
MRVPVWLARLLAGDVAVALMTEGRGFANAKARRELGWEPRYPSWRQGFREGLAQSDAGKVGQPESRNPGRMVPAAGAIQTP